MIRVVYIDGQRIELAANEITASNGGVLSVGGFSSPMANIRYWETIPAAPESEATDAG